MFAYLGMSESLLHFGRTALPGKRFLVTAVCFGTLAASAFQGLKDNVQVLLLRVPAWDRLLFLLLQDSVVFNLGVCPGIHHLWSSLAFMDVHVFHQLWKFPAASSSDHYLPFLCLSELLLGKTWPPGGLKLSLWFLISFLRLSFHCVPVAGSPLCLPWAVSACFRLYFSYHTSLLVLHFPVVFPFCIECFHIIF